MGFPNSRTKYISCRTSKLITIESKYTYVRCVPNINLINIKADGVMDSLVIDLDTYINDDITLYIEGNIKNIYIMCKPTLSKLIIDSEYDINCLFSANPTLELKGYADRVKSFYTPNSDVIFISPTTFIAFDTGIPKMYCLHNGDCFIEKDIDQESISCLSALMKGIF